MAFMSNPQRTMFSTAERSTNKFCSCWMCLQSQPQQQWQQRTLLSPSPAAGSAAVGSSGDHGNAAVNFDYEVKLQEQQPKPAASAGDIRPAAPVQAALDAPTVLLLAGFVLALNTVPQLLQRLWRMLGFD